MNRRYEVRVRACETCEDVDFVEKFIFRKNAESYCWEMNNFRKILGLTNDTAYIHDTKGDND